MDYSAARSHPLDVALAYPSGVAHAVAVLNYTSEHVGNRFYAAVRVPGKAFDVIIRIIGTEMVE
jgi:hypothetical protein